MITMPKNPNASLDWRDDNWSPPGWSDEEVTKSSAEASAWMMKKGGRRG